MIRLRLVLALGIVALAAACTAINPPPPRASQPPRVRCLSNPNETGTRPLIFFFCVESP